MPEDNEAPDKPDKPEKSNFENGVESTTKKDIGDQHIGPEHENAREN